MNLVKSKTMYMRIMSVLFAVALLTTFGIRDVQAKPFEVTKEQERKAYRQLQRQIRSYIMFPDEAIDQELTGEVEVVFTVNEQAKIEVVQVKGKDKLLKETAYNQLNQQEVYAKDFIKGQLFSVKVTYDLQEM